LAGSKSRGKGEGSRPSASREKKDTVQQKEKKHEKEKGEIRGVRGMYRERGPKRSVRSAIIRKVKGRGRSQKSICHHEKEKKRVPV